MTDQVLSARGATFIRIHEGFVPRWYADPVGIGTIGIGFTWRSASFRDWWGRNRPGQTFGPGATMTRDEADACLMEMVNAEYGKSVARFLGPVAQNLFDGATSPVFNCGAGALGWKWADALRAGHVVEAARLLRTTATTARDQKTGQRVQLRGLVLRRREEAELIQFGDYAIAGVLTSTDPLADGVLRRGERGEEVRALQSALAQRLHYDGKIDGLFGRGTEAAVLEYQRAWHLTPDGIAGPQTLGKLGLDFSTAKPAAPAEPPEPQAVGDNALEALLAAVVAFVRRLFGRT